MSEETKPETRERSRRYSDAPRIARLKDNAIYILLAFICGGVGGGGATGAVRKMMGNGNANLEKLERHFIPRVELMEKNFEMMQLLTKMDNRLENIEEAMKKGNP